MRAVRSGRSTAKGQTSGGARARGERRGSTLATLRRATATGSVPSRGVKAVAATVVSWETFAARRRQIGHGACPAGCSVVHASGAVDVSVGRCCRRCWIGAIDTQSTCNTTAVRRVAVDRGDRLLSRLPIAPTIGETVVPNRSFRTLSHTIRHFNVRTWSGRCQERLVRPLADGHRFIFGSPTVSSRLLRFLIGS
jgi:hypothetical protein